jgi:hypothetical protein
MSLVHRPRQLRSRFPRWLRCFLPAAACCLCLAGWVPLRADDSPLSFIPGDAAIVLRLKSIRPVLKAVLPWFPQKMRDDAKNVLTTAWKALGPDVLVADESWLVVFPIPDRDPISVYIIRTSEPGGPKTIVPPDRHAKFAGWEIQADTAEIAARFKECRAGKIKSLAATMKPPARELFEKGTVASLFVDGVKLRAAWRKEIDEFKRSVSAYLQEALAPPAGPAAVAAPQRAPAAAANQPAPNANNAGNAGWMNGDPQLLAAVQILWQAAEHLIEETDTLTIGLTADDQQTELQALLAVAANSPTDRFLARHPPSEMQALAHLPTGALAYFGVAGDLAELTRWLAQFNLSSLLRPFAARQAIDQRLQSVPLGKVEGYYGSLGFDEALAGPAESTLVLEGRSNEQAREFENRLIELTSASDRSSKSPPATRGSVRRRAETIAGQSVDLATWETPDGSGPDTNESGRAVLKAIYGTNPLQETRVTSLANLALLSQGGGRRAMLALLHNFQSSDGAVKVRGWRSARERLGSKVNLVVLLDLPRSLFVAMKFMTSLGMGGGLNDRAIAEAWEKNSLHLIHSHEPTYTGLSVAFEPQSVRFTVRIPREQVFGVFSLVQLMIDALEAQAPRDTPKPAKPELAPEQ